MRFHKAFRLESPKKKQRNRTATWAVSAFCATRPLTAFGQPLRQKTDLAPPSDLKPAAPPTFLPKT